MRHAGIARFPRCTAGSMTVEFTAVSFFFFLIVFLAMEIALALFWWQTAQKAVALGARAAVVSAPAADGLPAFMAKGNGGDDIFGVRCSDQSTPCTGFDTVACDGGAETGCISPNFDRIVNRMRELFAVIENEQVSISYADVGLGFAGGPPIPAVTVTLSGVPFETGFMSILGNLIGTGPLTTVPDISVTFTGEDLSNAGA